MRKVLCRKPEDETSIQVMEFKRLGTDERAKIAKEAGICARVTSGEGLAFKAALGLPWNKIRHLRRLVLCYMCFIISQSSPLPIHIKHVINNK